MQPQKSLTNRSLEVDRDGGEDAVCFMAGPQGIHFSAGAVHAYLAADREPPVVAAGISGGALTCAAMYKAYHELKKSQGERPDAREAARWTWFRCYIEKITYDPLSPIWQAIPNPVDFFAETTPVEDLSCPEELKRDETEARHQYHRLVRLGNWLGGMGITVGDVADLIVRRVRWKERYGGWRLQAAACVFRALWIGWLLALQAALDPRLAWFPLRFKGGKPVRAFRPTPLFGYAVWSGAMLWLLALAAGFALAPFHPWICGALVLAALFLPAHLLFIRESKSGSAGILKPLGLDQGLLHKYYFKRWLLDLFGDLTVESPGAATGAPMHALIVAAAVNKIEKLPSAQLWARPNKSVRLRDAVTAAMAVPGIFEPERPEPAHWLTSGARGSLGSSRLALVDGHVIGSNPLPSFFNWIAMNWRKNKHRSDIEKLFTSEAKPAAALRVVYSVPIEALTRDHEVPRESLNIVENGLTSLALQRRRDTEMESLQTQFISGLEAEIRKKKPAADKDAKFPIFPMPISPEGELAYGNALDPERKESLGHVAQGCRRTLESIYRERLSKSFPGAAEVQCHSLLKDVAAARHGAGFIREGAPGMMEVCGECSRKLRVRAAENSAIDKSKASYGVTTPPHDFFPNLADEKRSRIIFLANGGVFRGSFHIGVAAAMRAAKITPDLVVGSSVGAIIGAALSAMSRIKDDPEAYRYLGELTRVFLNCDRKVALTRSLKNVAKQLGVRGRSIDASPRQIRSMIRKGGSSDASYALAGAPPALIDAMSDLFLMPRSTTQRIAAKFVSGHITDAVRLFAKAVQKETLRRLSVEECVMGAGLLEQTAAELLFPPAAHADRHAVQPYLGDPDNPGTAFFATATHLNRRATILLGRDFPEEIPAPAKYNFLESCLASSAFPVVFAPRAVSDLFPGLGRTDVLLSDGGIFDNLPFFPAIRVLSDMQDSLAKADGETPDPLRAYERLRQRQAKPALMIAAGLDCNPSDRRDAPDGMLAMRKHAGALSNNVKIRSFVGTSNLVYRMTARLLDAYRDCKCDLDATFADGMVPAAVLQIIPADDEHLNGTFEFCRATGLNQDKMRKSIAHGCFQTLASLASEPADDVLGKAIGSCLADNRMERVDWIREEGSNRKTGDCPYFEVNHDPLACPFHVANAGDVQKVHEACAQDGKHREIRKAQAIPRGEGGRDATVKAKKAAAGTGV